MTDTQGKVTWINFYWLCAAGFAVSLAHCGVFCMWLYYKPHRKPLDQKTCDPIVVTVIKMQPRKLIVSPVVKMGSHPAAHAH